MELFFCGAEIGTWRNLLYDNDVRHVSMSYMGLRRRTKFTRPWVISEHFKEDTHLFLDSGGYTVNSEKGQDAYSTRDLKEIAAAYMAFISDNIDAVEFVSEFDASVLGQEWIEAMRTDFYDDLPDDKFMPVWHGDLGIDVLDNLCQRYARVGVPQVALGGRNLVPELNKLVRRYGTKLHGIAMTKPNDMAAVSWSSVASTSWLSPSQFGDTQVWVGNELKRYPKKYKDQARKRHRTLFNNIGFDAQKIEDDDRTEVLRLAIWSWNRLMDSLNDKERVTRLPDSPESDGVSSDAVPVDRPNETADNGVTTPGKAIAPRERARQGLPIMGLDTLKESYVEAGETKERDVPLVKIRSQSMRVCNGCFLATKCPAFEPGSNCAYDIPITIRTKDQMQALQNSLIDMQSQRVFLMKMAEDLEGGYADPNLSSEMDRLQKMIKIKADLEQDSFSVKFEAKGKQRADMGVLSRLFGQDAGRQARELPAGPVQADNVIQDMNVIDAEIEN